MYRDLRFNLPFLIMIFEQIKTKCICSYIDICFTGLDAPNSFFRFLGDGFQKFTAQFRFAPKGIDMSATSEATLNRRC